MNMTKLYKLLLVASLLLYAVVFLTRYFGDFFYDAGTLDALSRDGYAGIIANHDWVSYVALFAYALTTIGLLLYQSWARLVFVIITAVSLIMALIIGLDVKNTTGEHVVLCNRLNGWCNNGTDVLNGCAV